MGSGVWEFRVQGFSLLDVSSDGEWERERERERGERPPVRGPRPRS